MKSDCKSFDVFNFSSEDELAELDAANRLSKFRNPSDVDKYNFLANVARGNDYQSQDMSNIQCVDVDDQNCENALSCFSLRSGAETSVTEHMCAMDDFVVVNSVSHEQHHPQFTPDEFKPESFSARLESRSSTPEAASPDNSSQLNFSLHDSPSHDESVDASPDSDESMSAGSTSTSSHILGDDVTLDAHGLERGPSSGHCFGTWESGNKNVAVRPDYVTYRGRYCTESEIIFTSSSIELKSSTADGKDGTFCFEWGIDDIVDINSQWSERLRVAMVKIRLISKDEMQAEGGQSTSGIEELQFAAVELNWYKKQEEIVSLGARYKVLWNVVFDSVIGRDEEALPGKNGVCIPRRRYLPNFDEPFEEVVYPKGDADAVTISKQDVDLLQPDTFVNDTIIDFYIKYLKNEIRQTDRHRFHFFNSFFFRKLIDLDKDPSSAFEGRAAFQRVRKWTRKVNLFEKDYVFIPVNFNYHWSLIVICHPGEVANCQAEDMEKPLKVPCILHMDSIKGSHTGLKDLVQSYLWEEWKEKHKEACEDLSSKFFNLRFVPLELPQQQNSFDCGLFLLHYVERFLKDAPPNLSPFKISKFSSFLNVDWFPAAEPSLKRVEIQNLIREILKKENSPDPCNGNPCSSISNYPASNSEIETGVELISERCSPSKSCRGKLSSSPAGDGIEITLLPSSSQCAGDSGLVLREFFEEGATAGSYLDGQFPNFDLQPCYSEFKIAMSAMEEDEEAGEQCDYSQANETGTCVFPFSQSGLASDDNDSEVDVRDNHIENPNTDEEIDQPRSPSMENEERLTETPASGPSEIFDVADSQSPDPTVHSNGKVDHLAEFDQQNEDIRSAEECLVGDNLISGLDGLKVSDRINGESVLESGKETPAKRSGDDTVLESDEQQPSKKLRLSNDLQF